MDRLSYFLRRVLLMVPTFVGITLVCFALCQVVPGGPVEQALASMRGMGAGEAGDVYKRQDLRGHWVIGPSVAGGQYPYQGRLMGSAP